MQILENKPKNFGINPINNTDTILPNVEGLENKQKFTKQKLGIEKEFEEVPKKKLKPKKVSPLTSIIPELNFSIRKDNAEKFIPIILTALIWGIFMIANHHQGEKTLLKINHVRKELKDLKADYYTSNAELSNQSIQSEVAKLVEELGIKELRTPPEKINMDTENPKK